MPRVLLISKRNQEIKKKSNRIRFLPWNLSRSSNEKSWLHHCKRQILLLKFIMPSRCRAMHTLETNTGNAKHIGIMKKDFFVNNKAWLQFIYMVSAILALYMIIGSEAGLLCNIICFTYPALISVEVFYLHLRTWTKTRYINFINYLMHIQQIRFHATQLTKLVITHNF